MGLNLNLEDQLVFYGAYHSNPINKGRPSSLLGVAGPLHRGREAAPQRCEIRPGHLRSCASPAASGQRAGA
jgi:hypothetical protein